MGFLPGFLASTFLITVAEMGDKTQLLSISFATKYKPQKVLAGIFIATIAVHLLSVVIGRTVSEFVPLRYLRVAIGLSFIGFGLWTLRGDTYEDDNNPTRTLGVVATVAIAFFLAELGDKTQLATISLAAKYNSFMGVWLGSTLGMVIADGAAIIVGVAAGKRIPEHIIKYVSAAIFIIFGVVTTYQSLV